MNSRIFATAFRNENLVFITIFDLVAQLVEHLTFNQRVLGSNPSGITFFLQRFISVDLVAQLVEHLTFNQRVLGSNPSGITIF